MKDDPIVEEVRRAGDAYFRQFNYSISAAFAVLHRRTEQAERHGRRVVSLPPRRVSPQSPVRK